MKSMVEKNVRGIYVRDDEDEIVVFVLRQLGRFFHKPKRLDQN